MSDTDIHSCGYYCDRPACIKAQRDELRDKLFEIRTSEKNIQNSDSQTAESARPWVKTYSGGKPNYTQPDIPNNLPIVNLKQDELIYPTQPEETDEKNRPMSYWGGKKWVGLTGEELQEIYQGAGTVHFKFAMVEAKLKEKNS
jgi:hypothetical protein